LKPGVIISFDVECSMGGAWQNPELKPVSPAKGMMGEFGNKRLGIPLICDILEKNNLKAAFFVEPFNKELGYPNETEKVCSYLMERGQDIELHIHPNHYNYKLFLENKPFVFTDQMYECPPLFQLELLNKGMERIEKWTGKKPIAFRAGNLGADEETLKILSKAGIKIDSSYSYPFAGGQCAFSKKEPFNGSKWYGDVLETALSGFESMVLPGIYSSKPLDLMGISFEEARDAVKKICKSGADAVLILHSFSLFKVKDKQYSKARLNRVVKKRFEKFCAWLDKNREDYPPRTFEEICSLIEKKEYSPQKTDPVKIKNPIRAGLGKSVQFANNFYRF